MSTASTVMCRTLLMRRCRRRPFWAAATTMTGCALNGWRLQPCLWKQVPRPCVAAAFRPKKALAPAWEIGRASCREGVYVSVGAVGAYEEEWVVGVREEVVGERQVRN